MRPLATVALAALLVPLNSTIVAVVLPAAAGDLGAGLAGAGWLITGYLIAMAALQPVGGKLGDRLGRRAVFLAGLAWFGLASVGAALSPDLWLLVVFRIQQAAAGALLLPNGIALLRETAPPDRLASQMGLIGAAMTVGAAAGPLAGGLLAGAGGWRATFLVNLPVVALALLLALRTLPAGSARPLGRSPFDTLGAGLLAAGLALGAWALNGAGIGGSARTAAGAAAAALLAAFLRHEARHPDPVLSPALLRKPAFASAATATAFGNLAMYVLLIALPVLLARRGGWSHEAVGALLVVMFATAAVLSPLGGRLADSLGRRAPAVAGQVVVAAAIVPLALDPGLGAAGLGVCLALAGIGIGISTPALQVAAVEAGGDAAPGAAAGAHATARYAGSIAGTAALAGPLAPAAAGAGGFTLLFAALAAAAALAATAALALPGRKQGAWALAAGRAPA